MQDRIKELINLGLKAQKEHKYQAALDYFKEAYKLAEQLGHSNIINEIMMLISNLIDITEEATMIKGDQQAPTTDISAISKSSTTKLFSFLNQIPPQEEPAKASEEKVSLGRKQEQLQQRRQEIMKEIQEKKYTTIEVSDELEEIEEDQEMFYEKPPPKPYTPAEPEPEAAPEPAPEAKPEAGPPVQPVTGRITPAREPTLGGGRPPPKTERPARPTPTSPVALPVVAPGGMPAPAPHPASAARPKPAPAPAKQAAKPVSKPAPPPPPDSSAPIPADDRPRMRTPADKKKAKETEKGEKAKPPEKEPIKKIKRFGDISAPMEMTEKKDYLVKVGLRVFKEDVVGMPVPMEIVVPKVGPPLVEVFVIGQDFKIDQARRTLVVPLETDSDVLNFQVIPQKDGIKNLTVEFYQEGSLIGRAILKIIVKKKKEPISEALSSTSVTVASHFGETKLDATLRIVRYGNDFFFSLFTPRAQAVVSQNALFGKVTIDTSKVHKLEGLMEEAVFDRSNPREALDKLRNLGAQIYNYIPTQIQKTIKSIVPKYLMIETGDLLVPWELAYDGEDFLCSKYCIGKRVFDETRDFRPPPFCIGKKILDLVFIGASPKGVPEISVNAELELFDTYDKSKRIKLNKLIEPNAKKAKVLDALSKGDMIHLTCHGKFEEAEPTQSALLLSDDALTAKEIDALEIKNWPLIFANACSTGAISGKVIGIGGIARSFLEAGAIAFLGPLFEIPDDIALEFAKEFYNDLLYNDANVGEAIFNTRKKLRDQFGGAFWAIFSLYGDPTLNLCRA